MKTPLFMGFLYMVAFAAPAAAGLIVEARYRAPRTLLVDQKIQACEPVLRKLFGACEKGEWVADPENLSGRVRWNCNDYAPALDEKSKRALLAQLDSQWHEPVNIYKAQAFGQGFGPVVRNGSVFDPKSAGAVTSMIPSNLDASSSGLLFDGRAQGGPGATPQFAPNTLQSWVQTALTPPKERSRDIVLPVERPVLGDVPYAKEIESAAKKHGLDPKVLSAVVAAKSGYRAGLDGNGINGLMGLSRGTFVTVAGKGKNILDPQQNLDAGAKILAGLLKQFDGDIHRALAAYQVGPRAVLISGGIPSDRGVREFLAAYERAYRAGPNKPPVKAEQPPTVARRAKDQVQIVMIDRNAKGAARYRPLIESIAKKYGVDPDLMQAMIMRESEGDPDAVSHKGAQGLGQLMPETAQMLGVKNPHDPAENLRGMARHLDYLLDKYENPALALAAYNAGEGRVDRNGGKIPYIRETRNYVEIVRDNYFDLTGKRLEIDPSLYAPKPQPKPKATAKRRAKH